MLARLINEKFANRKDGNQLSEVYEQLAVVSEVEPERISPEELEELANDTDKESGEEEENKKIFQELNDIVIQKTVISFFRIVEEKIWHKIVHLNNARFCEDDKRMYRDQFQWIYQ